MIEPTNLNDPYVIQLIEALAKRDDEIERLNGLVESCSARNESDADEIERLKAVVDAAEKADNGVTWDYEALIELSEALAKLKE